MATIAALASATRTANGTQTFSVGDGTTGATATLTITATAGAGGGTLQVSLQQSFDDGATWTWLTSFRRFTATGSQTITVPPAALVSDTLLRLSWDVHGAGASFTFQVDVNTDVTPARDKMLALLRSRSGTDASTLATLFMYVDAMSQLIQEPGDGDGTGLPDWSRTVLHLGDVHQGATVQARLDTAKAALQALGVPAVLVQIGDLTEPPGGNRDVDGKAFINAIPGAVKRVVIGNHDLNGTRDGDAAATAYGYNARNWTYDIPGVARLIGISPLNWAPGDTFVLDQIALDYLAAALASATLPCIIFEHAPFYNTVTPPLDGGTYYSSADAQMYVTPEASLKTILGSSKWAKLFVNGHTHSPITASGFLSTIPVGTREVYQVQCSALKGTHKPADVADPLICTMTTVLADGTGVEIRAYDLANGTWLTWPGTQNTVTTYAFPSHILPVNEVVPSITGTPTVGQTLTASTGTWTGGDRTFTYQWQRNGVNIAAATASTYTLVGADEGTTIAVVVTATNDGGSGSATSAATTPVAPVPVGDFLSEPMTAADGTTVQSMANWVKLAASTVDAVVDGNAAHGSGTGNAIYRNTTAPGSADYSVTITLKVATDNNSSSAGGFGRMDATLVSGYNFRYDSNGNKVDLYSFVNNVSTQLGTVNVTCVTGDTLTLVMAGDQISVKRNGTEIIAPVTNTVHTAAGYVGFRITGLNSSAAGVHIDALTATH